METIQILSLRRVVAREWLFLACVLGLAIALRVDCLFATGPFVDSEEAIVGLMAKHILDGHGFPTFYYGKSFIGTLEPLLIAGMFELFGSTIFALKLVPLFLSSILILPVYFIGLEVGSRFSARAAAVLLAIPASSYIFPSLEASGGQSIVSFLGLVSVFLAIRWMKSEGTPWWGALFIGGLLGLGWWTGFEILYFLLPVVWCMMCSLVRQRGDMALTMLVTLAALVVGFLLGGFPFWKFNLENEFRYFSELYLPDLDSVVIGLVETVRHTLPMLLGAQLPWQSVEKFPLAYALVGLLFGSLLLGLVAERRRALVGVVVGFVDRGAPIEMLVLIAVSGVLMVSLSPYGLEFNSTVHLVPIYPVLCLLIAVAIDVIHQQRLAYSVVLGPVLALNLLSLYYPTLSVPPREEIVNGEQVASDHSELLQWLESNQFEWVKTNYTVGYRLAFESDERVRFIQFDEPHSVRIDSYEVRGREQAEAAVPYVLTSTQASRVKRALSALGYGFKLKSLSTYSVLYGLHPLQQNLQPFDPKIVEVNASHNGADARFAIDGDVHTRWFSDAAQVPGMWYRLSILNAPSLRGISYEFGSFIYDYPRRLRIALVLPDGTKEVLLTPEDYEAVRYLGDRTPGFSLYFPHKKVAEILLEQEGEERLYDWSIPELQLFQ